MRLTALERDVWIATFAANQPQPESHSDSRRNGLMAKYWAAQAVFVIRGETRNANPQEQEAMFSAMTGGAL